MRIQPSAKRGDTPSSNLTDVQIGFWNVARILPAKDLTLGNATRCRPLVGADHAVVDQFVRDLSVVSTPSWDIFRMGAERTRLTRIQGFILDGDIIECG